MPEKARRLIIERDPRSEGPRLVEKRPAKKRRTA
jgi:hypothetical protein